MVNTRNNNMWTFKRTMQEAFDTGGILLFGLGALFLFRQQYYPSFLGPLSFGMISFGAVGFVRHLVKHLGSRIEDSKYQEILLLLEQRQSEIEENRCMLEELRYSCSRFMAMREILETWQGDPSLIEEQAAALAKILEPKDVVTSRESNLGTPNDVIETVPLDMVSPRESENKAVSGENAGLVIVDDQQQVQRNPKSLKEQALQANISVILKRHASGNLQTEESMVRYPEIADESELRASEDVSVRGPEKDLMKQD